MLDACLFSQAAPLGQSFKTGRSSACLFFPLWSFPTRDDSRFSIGVVMLSTLKHAYKSLLWHVDQDGEAYVILLFVCSFTASVRALSALNAALSRHFLP